ncbi:MAG TPA: hypothetical protein VK841_09230, partial [Polyangiaceae bacterium]|nr:hypothetical protein [Polyangiaceae bacterium]
MRRDVQNSRKRWLLTAAVTASAMLSGACRPASATTGVSPTRATSESDVGTVSAGPANGAPANAASAGGPSGAAAGTYTKPPVEELRRKLTPLQFEVTQHAA